MRSTIEPMKKVAKTVTTQATYPELKAKKAYSSGKVEGLNTKIKPLEKILRFQNVQVRRNRFISRTWQAA